MKKDSPNEGELIKLARKGKGLTQKQLSEKTGLAVVTIQQYERNLRQPKLENIKNQAALLRSSSTSFLRETLSILPVAKTGSCSLNKMSLGRYNSDNPLFLM